MTLISDLQLQKEVRSQKQEAAEQQRAIAARLEARQEQLADERSSLDAQIQEATAPAASSEESQAALVASLASEVEELRFSKFLSQFEVRTSNGQA